MNIVKLRNRKVLRVIICIGMIIGVIACKQEKKADCVNPVGPLCFSTDEVKFGNIYWNQEYRDTIVIANPTDKAVRLGRYGNAMGVYYRVLKGDERDWPIGGVEIAAKSQDSLIIMVKMVRDSQLGYFFTFLRFEVNGQLVDAYQGISVEANILENFDTTGLHKENMIPKIAARDREFDFDTIVQGKKVNHTFILKNEGNKDLIIRKIETTCGCTVAIPEKRVLSAGESTKLDVSFNSDGRMGVQHKVITVICNDPENSLFKLIVKGYVK